MISRDDHHEYTSSEKKANDQLSSREKSNCRRRELFQRLELIGIHLSDVGSGKYKTQSGKVVGIAYASERRPGRWWLGLPKREYDAVVLLCEDGSDRILPFALPKVFYTEHKNNLSLVSGQIKFNVFSKFSKFYLSVPKKGNIDVDLYLEAFDPLK